MSWLRSAVNKAVEVGGRNNITRAVKNYADTVVHHAGQAVAGGTKILQEHMGVRNFKSFKQTVKRLEEVAVSCRGSERTQLLRRWLVAFKEIDRTSGSLSGGRSLEQQLSSEGSSLSPRNASTVLYFDSDMGGEPMNFHDVFLYSQALEGIILSMILEPPNDEEVSLLLEIFQFSVTGGKEVHNAILSSIQDLAKVFAGYQDEVLVKRDELLQFAQAAIQGLKVNANVARIDAESSNLRQKIDELGNSQFLRCDDNESAAEHTTPTTIEALKEALAEIRVCSKLEGLLLNMKSIRTGETLEVHSQKVDKLKILSESLASSSLKAEKRISDHRHQKEEALSFRLAKVKEVGDVEKELSAEIADLEKQRNELETELKKVNVSLSAALSRLKKTREEKDQFDEANNRMVEQLTVKEDDLLRSIASCKVESDVVRTWINFLEDTWLLQSTYSEQKEKQTNDDLEKYGKSFVNLVGHHLLQCKEVLSPSISRIGTIVENLRSLGGRSEITSSTENELSVVSNPHVYIEEEYLKVETKIVATFSVIDNMKQLFYTDRRNAYRGDHSNVDKLFEDIEKMREEFESIERPTLNLETPPQREVHETEKQSKSSTQVEITDVPKSEVKPVSPVQATDKEFLDPEDELAMLESEFGKISGDYSTEEIGGWEFDELEQDLKSESSTVQK